MEYIDYLEEHRELVKRAWNIWKNSIENPFGRNVTDNKLMDAIINVHDFSRLDPEEIDVGEALFKGEEVSSHLVREYQQHHWKMNPHHPEFWVEEDGMLLVDMNVRALYMVENICDQAALAYKAGDTLRERINSRPFVGSPTEKLVFDLLVQKGIRALEKEKFYEKPKIGESVDTEVYKADREERESESRDKI